MPSNYLKNIYPTEQLAVKEIIVVYTFKIIIYNKKIIKSIYKSNNIARKIQQIFVELRFSTNQAKIFG